ncbi:MAG TPA: tripartite tricarboxylate transporter substrate binding protein [Burkholderiales bacterium]|jgi:tripartite-type tricarboxylate transporter receptor subunit TctC
MKACLRTLAAALVAAIGLTATMVHAEDAYPTHPIRFVVPAPAGGAPDEIARMVGEQLGKRLNTQVIVDNRGGGNGVIGSEIAKNAAADGYTIVLGYQGPFGINPGYYPKLPYDPVKDFSPLTMLATSQNILVVHPSFPARSVKELIEIARAKPGQINFASGGTGQSSHLSMELLMHMAGIKMVHIPYKGAGPALADTLGGQVPLHFVAVAPAIPLIAAHRLIPLGVTGGTRIPSLPDVPTIAEAGLPGYEVLTWYAAFAPAGIPQPVLKKLQDAIIAAVKAPALAATYKQRGLDPGGDPPDALEKYLQTDIARWKALIKAAGIKTES